MKPIKQEWLSVVSQANKKLNNSAYLDLSNIKHLFQQVMVKHELC